MTNIDHTKRAHAKLSASGAERWLNCPASVSLEANLPDTTSVFAQEGTLAHELAEKLLIKYFFNKRPNLSVYEADMLDYTQSFVDYVIGVYNGLKVKHKEEPSIMLEQRLDLTRWVPESFGTGDVTIICGDELHIVDLKYGKGVPVYAEGNPQLRLYALGAYDLFEALYDIDTITCHIAQPRLDSYSQEVLSANWLVSWADSTVAPVAKEAFEGSDKQKVGKWCGFCKASSFCKAQADHNLALAKYEFAPPLTLSLAEVSEAMTQGANLVKWLKAVEEYALGQALAGEDVPDYKLVEGRSVRKITDPDKVVDTLMSNGFDAPVLFERKLISLTAMEKLVGKKPFNDLCGWLLDRPAGKPALVPASDKREALHISTAKDDFESIN